MLPNLQPEVFFPRRVQGASPVSHYWFTLSVVAEDTSLNGGFVPGCTFVVLSPFAINRSVALWGANSEMLSPKRWPGGEDEVAPVGSNCGFLSFLERPKGAFEMSC